MKTIINTKSSKFNGIIGILLSLILVIGMISAWYMKADASPEGEAIYNINDLQSINNNGKYYLADNIINDNSNPEITWTLPENKSIILDLNGKTITRVTIVIPETTTNEQTTLTLNDYVGGGKISNSGVNNPSIYIKNKSKFILNNGTLCNNHNNNAVRNDEGEFIMNGGSISSNDNSADAIVYNNSGRFTMNDGTISNNSCKDSCVVCNYSSHVISFESKGPDGLFVMNGGTISENTSYDCGGGVYNFYCCTFIMNGGSISNNKAHQGGGIYNMGTTTINGCSITNNESTDYEGGGISNHSTLTINDGTITNNKSKTNGGGIFVSEDSVSTTINGGTIYNNTSNTNNTTEDIFIKDSNDDVIRCSLSKSPTIGVIRLKHNNNKHNYITILDALTNTTPISIDFDSGHVPFTFTKKSDNGPNPSDYIFNFRSVNNSYGIGVDGNELKLDSAATEPTISLTPPNIDSLYGDNNQNTFSVSVTTAANHEIAGYQWYKSTTNSNTGGTPINGATNSTYTVPSELDVREYYYYCMVKSKKLDNNVYRQDPSNVGTFKVLKNNAEYTTNVTAKNILSENGSMQELVNAGSTNVGTIQYALGDNDKTAPTTGWSTSIPTGTKAGQYYVWYKVDGTSNYNGIEPECISVRMGYKQGSYGSIPVTPGKIKNITGSKDAYLESDEFKVLIENEGQLKTLLNITDEELAQGVNVWFDAKDTTNSIPDADKAIIDIARGNYQVGQYLSINVYKRVGNDGFNKKINETNGNVKMKLTLSDKLKKSGRNFAIVGVHNSKGKLMGGVYNYDANTFSFENNEFSPFAFVYKDASKVPTVPKTSVR